MSLYPSRLGAIEGRNRARRRNGWKSGGSDQDLEIPHSAPSCLLIEVCFGPRILVFIRSVVASASRRLFYLRFFGFGSESGSRGLLFFVCAFWIGIAVCPASFVLSSQLCFELLVFSLHGTRLWAHCVVGFLFYTFRSSECVGSSR